MFEIEAIRKMETEEDENIEIKEEKLKQEPEDRDSRTSGEICRSSAAPSSASRDDDKPLGYSVMIKFANAIAIKTNEEGFNSGRSYYVKARPRSPADRCGHHILSHPVKIFGICRRTPSARFKAMQVAAAIAAEEHTRESKHAGNVNTATPVTWKGTRRLAHGRRVPPRGKQPTSAGRVDRSGFSGSVSRGAPARRDARAPTPPRRRRAAAGRPRARRSASAS